MWGKFLTQKYTPTSGKAYLCFIVVSNGQETCPEKAGVIEIMKKQF